MTATPTSGQTTDLLPKLERAFLMTPLHRELGVSFRAGVDEVWLEGEVGERFARFDGGRSLHGGAVATLLDTATALVAVVATGTAWATASLHVDYVRPLAVGKVLVHATLVHQGRSRVLAAAEVRDAEDRVCALARATLLADSRTGQGT